jgi:hypothetical protein
MSDAFSLTLLPMVNRIAEARKALVHQLQVVESGEPTDALMVKPRLAITIDGARMDDAMLAVARPAIVCELRGRIASLDRDLEAMGVRAE